MLPEDTPFNVYWELILKKFYPRPIIAIFTFFTSPNGQHNISVHICVSVCVCNTHITTSPNTNILTIEQIYCKHCKNCPVANATIILTLSMYISNFNGSPDKKFVRQMGYLMSGQPLRSVSVTSYIYQRMKLILPLNQLLMLVIFPTFQLT